MPSAAITTVTAAAVVAVLLLALPEARGIQCYKCNSHKDAGCAALQPLAPNASRDVQFLAPCDPGPQGEEAFCRTRYIKVLAANEGKGEERWVRSCGWVRYKNPCYMYDDQDHHEHVCQCFTDGCNAAPALAPAAAGLLLLLLLLLPLAALSLLQASL